MAELKFDALSDAFRLLDDQKSLEEVQQLNQRLDDGLYFVAFVGQFSAGKSTLLNNLLGRSILPQGTMETTPILTYIRYGEEEKATLFYFDGSEEDISLEEVAGIMQKGARGREVPLQDIEHMEIFIRAELLSNGMVLLDTPGINTLIERHEELLADTLALASNIVYVTGHSLSKVDAEKISAMIQHGFPMSFVRTRCDEINEVEESYEQVRRDELKVFHDVLGNGFDANRFFHISNLPESKYFAKLKGVRAMLETVGKDVKTSLMASVQRQVDVLNEKAKVGLQNLLSDLKTAQSNRNNELESDRKKLEREIENLTYKIKNNRERLIKNVESRCRELQSDAERNIDTTVDGVRKKILSSKIESNDDMKLLVQRETRQALQSFIQALNRNIDPMLKDINGDITTTVGNEIDLSDLPETEDYSALVDEQNFETAELNRQLDSIRKNRRQLEESLARSENKHELQSMQNELAELEQQIAALQTEHDGMIYEPQMIEVGGDQSGSQLGKNIGKFLDFAMIFIPQTAMMSAAKKVGFFGKIGQTLAKGGKYGKAIVTGLGKGKVMSNISKVTKTYKTVKRTERVINAVQTGLNTYNTVKEAAPVSVFDYLTAEHWGEQLGKQFDTPPRVEEDKVYRYKFDDMKRQLSEQIKRKQTEAFRLKKDAGLFRSRREEEKARLESLNVDESELRRKMDEHKQKLRREAKEQALADWRDDWANSYGDKLRAQLEDQVKDYAHETASRLNAYRDDRFAAIEQKLSDKKQQYDQLLSMSASDIEIKIAAVESALQRI